MDDILDDEDLEDEEVIIRFFGFLRAMMHNLETGTLKLTPEEALEKLGLSIVSEGSFIESFSRVYTSGLGKEELEKQGQWLAMLLQPAWDGKCSEPAIHDLCLQTVLEIRELDYTSTVETASGYLAVAPKGSKVGDEICLLHRSDRSDSFGLSEYRTESVSRTIGDYTLLELR